MYFNHYAPSTLDQNLEAARAMHTFNAVKRFSGKDEPRFGDYWEYCKEKLTMRGYIQYIKDEDGWTIDRRAEWAAIREAVREAGQPLRRQNVVYLAICADHLAKCGQTNNLVQRHCNINREHGITKMWYLPVESKEEAIAAEHALHRILDKARCMNRVQGCQDYYECEAEAAERFFYQNAKKMYQAIMEAIGDEEE